jgi:aryl-alcohol dehydrogenase-like predicted oxidoreductase
LPPTARRTGCAPLIQPSHRQVQAGARLLLARAAPATAGAKGPAQIEQNVKAIAWNLSAEEMAEINQITLG